MTKPPQDYRSFVQTAKSLANKSEEFNLQLMRLLVETEPLLLIWHGHPHKLWKDVLREERLCTMSSYMAFKKALALGLDVDTLGVSATCLLAKQPKDVRVAVLKKTTQWVKSHEIPPRYQLVSEFVMHNMKSRVNRKLGAYAKLRIERDQLREECANLVKYIERLEAVLLKHKIQVPLGES